MGGKNYECWDEQMKSNVRWCMYEREGKRGMTCWYSRSNFKNSSSQLSTMLAKLLRFFTGLPLKARTCVLTMSSYPILMSATRTYAITCLPRNNGSDIESKRKYRGPGPVPRTQSNHIYPSPIIIRWSTTTPYAMQCQSS